MGMFRVIGPITAIGVSALAATALEVPFGPRQVIENTLDNPRTAIPADIDLDGDTDIVVAVLASNTFAWYENDGEDTPGFTRHILTTAATGAREVWVDDINRDGRPDIIGASRADNRVRWFRNEGGSPALFTEFLVDASVLSSWSVYSADIDGDGDPDILSAGRDDDRISWHENDGADPPVWTKHVVDTNARRAQKAFADDVDGDGDIDILSASGAGDEIAWYENDGAANPTFIKHSLTTSANNAKWVWTADLDADGDTDILAAAETEATIEWFENNGAPDPVFTRRTIASVAGAKACIPIDIDQDGDLDVLSNGIGANEVLIHENLGGTPLSWTTYTVSQESNNPLTAFPGDIDGDGLPDILVSSFEDDTIGWYKNRWIRQGPVWPQQDALVRAPSLYTSVTAADLDHDGYPNLILASSSGHVEFLRRVGTAYEPSPIATGGGPVVAHAADLDRDGDLDVAVADASGAIFWCQSNGAPIPGFMAQLISNTIAGPSAVETADLNHDGHADILVGTNAGELWLFENDGTPTPAFSARLLDAASMSITDLAVLDVNRDGSLDILATDNGLDALIVYQSDGAPIPAFVRSVMPDPLPGAAGIALSDLDRDGDTDAMVATPDGLSLAILLNDGMPNATLSGFGWSASTVLAIGVTDSNHNGLDDVVVFSQQNQAINYGENFAASVPFFLISNLLGGFSNVTDLIVVDLDRDGLDDIVLTATDGTSGSVNWVRNRGGQASMTTMPTARPEALIGRSEGMFTLQIRNFGGRGDDSVSLSRARLRLTGPSGSPLSNTEVHAIIRSFQLYADSDSSGVLERLGDELLVDLEDFTIDADGRVLLEFDPTLVSAEVTDGAVFAYFIAVTLTDTADQAVPNSFAIELEAAVTGDIVQVPDVVPVRLTPTTPAQTGLITATVPLPGQVVLGTPWIRHTIDDALLGAEGPRGADFNGDGLIDYAVAWEQSAVAKLYLHPSAENARDPWPGVIVGNAPNGETAVPVDLDGDGMPEIVTAISAGPRTIRVNFAPTNPADLLNSAAWTTQTFTQTPIDLWVYVEPADLDGQNGIDLVIGSIGREGDFGAQIGWLRSPADPTDAAAWTYHKLYDIEWTMSLEARDMDLDGDTDIAFTNRFGAPDERGAYWLVNPGPGTPEQLALWERRTIGSEGREVGFLDLGDIDGDGILDAVVPDRERHLNVYLGTTPVGDAWTKYPLTWPEDVGLAKAARIGDLDADGEPDIVISAVEAGQIEALSGLAWLRKPAGFPLANDWVAYEIAGFDGEKFDLVQLDDVDGDGDLDVIAAEERNNSQTVPGLGVVWYENPAIQLTGDANRDRVTNAADLAAVLSEWGPATLLSTADFNNDQRVDASDLAILLGVWGRTW